MVTQVQNELHLMKTSRQNKLFQTAHQQYIVPAQFLNCYRITWATNSSKQLLCFIYIQCQLSFINTFMMGPLFVHLKLASQHVTFPPAWTTSDFLMHVPLVVPASRNVLALKVKYYYYLYRRDKQSLFAGFSDFRTCSCLLKTIYRALMASFAS